MKRAGFINCFQYWVWERETMFHWCCPDIFEPRDQEIGDICSGTADFEAPKLSNGQSCIYPIEHFTILKPQKFTDRRFWSKKMKIEVLKLWNLQSGKGSPIRYKPALQHNLTDCFRISEPSEDPRILCRSGTSYDGIKSSKILEVSVGNGMQINATVLKWSKYILGQEMK